MKDGSKYMGQIIKTEQNEKNTNDFVQHGWGTSRWKNGAKFSG